MSRWINILSDDNSLQWNCCLATDIVVFPQAGYAQPAYSSPHANQSGNSPGMNQAGYVITGSPVVNQAGYVTPASPAINQAGYVVPGAPVNQAGYVVPDASPVATSAAASPTSDPTKLSTAALRAKQRAEAIRRQQQEMEKMEKKLTKDPTVQVQKRVSAYKQATVRPQPSTSDRTSNEQYQAVAAQPGPPAGEPFVAMFPFAGDKNFGQIDMAQGEVCHRFTIIHCFKLTSFLNIASHSY